MEKFQYKTGLLTQTLEISKEMITWKNKQIPANEITGFGIGLMNVAKMAIGNAIGGMAGALIARGGSSKELDKNTPLKEMGGMAQLIIGYKPAGSEKIKGLQIPLNLKDEQCIRMLEKLKTDYQDKFIGAGGINSVTSELKISQKWVYIVVGIIVLIIVAFSIYTALQAQ